MSGSVGGSGKFSLRKKGAAFIIVPVHRIFSHRKTASDILWKSTGVAMMLLMLIGNISWSGCFCEGCCEPQLVVQVESKCGGCCPMTEPLSASAESVHCGCSGMDSLEPLTAENAVQCQGPVLTVHQPAVTRLAVMASASLTSQWAHTLTCVGSPPPERPLVLRI